ncbi:MAG TPA: family 20 glycosylhydrolase, partial [Candidatus Deferrimicrobium sp.]|nr:family 20 glycosylhydrolase [Candidatus Deferrimicrobium sp.]
MKYLLIEGFELIENVKNYKLNLLPFPAEIGEIEGYYKVGKELGLLFEEVEAEEVIIETITEGLSTIEGVSLKKIDISRPKNLKTEEFRATEVLDETYALYFQDDLLIIMSTADIGIYYGVNTFLQLLKPIDGNLIIPQLEIFDYPAYEIRCITDQTSRNQIPTVENLKKTIKFLSKFKINYHILYMEDSFKFKKYPDLGEARGGYTAEEIKEVQDYAKRYFVELTPIFNSLGHQDNILMTNFPKYAHLAEFPGAAVFDVNNPETREFLEDLYAEVTSAFDSTYFHMGLDETWDLGLHNTKEIIKEKGKGKVMLEFYNFLIETAKKLGKQKLLCYHDNVLGQKELFENLPKDLIIFYWDYWPKRLFWTKRKYGKAGKLKKQGYPVILSPTLYDYARNFPDIKNTIKNIVTMAQYGVKIEALGIATSVWGDFLNENLRECNYFGYLVTADAAWAPSQWNESRFKKSFAYFFYGLEDSKILEVLDDLNAYNDAHMMYPTKFYSHIWRHPFPSKKIKPKVGKLNRIQQKGEQAFKKIEILKPNVSKNVDNLDYLQYAAKLGIYLGKKYNIPRQIQKELNKGRDKYNPEELVKEITILKEYLESMKKDYKELWLRCAKPNGLDLILAKFDASLLFYAQKIEEIQNGIAWTDPYLKAEFITTPNKVKKGEPIFLRRKFSIKRPIKKCYIQGMGDMLTRLYLNGAKLGEIVSKMSLSVESIRQRIQLFDVTDKV